MHEWGNLLKCNMKGKLAENGQTNMNIYDSSVDDWVSSAPVPGICTYT